MPDLSKIQEPTLLLDKEKVLKNIRKMAEKAHRQNIRFRPHFKTHQSAEIGEWFRDFEVRAITVSSVKMAAYFAAQGWLDITIASPVNLREIERIDELAGQITLHLIIDSAEVCAFLAKNITQPLSIWLDVDTGYKRSGVDPQDEAEIYDICERIKDSRLLSLTGLFCHAGHTYQARSVDEVRQIHQTTLDILSDLRCELTGRGFSGLEISVGDTPSCAMLEDLGDADEMRPGTFVFNDLRQMNIGACREEEIAAVLACPVTGRFIQRRELIIYGGAVHLSKDYELTENGEKCFGLPAFLDQGGWGESIPGAYISHISQEVGTLKAPEQILENIKVGNLLAVYPAHICLTANLMKRYLLVNGSGSGFIDRL